jgi:excisionase family DNA binding protein
MEQLSDTELDRRARQSALAHSERILLRPDEVALCLGIGRSKTYALINSQDIPSIRIGGSIRIPLDALKAWVKAREEQANERTS